MWTGLIALLVAAGSLFGFAWLVARKLPWELTEKTPHLADVVKLAFAVVAGLGGVVALVVAYRRQRNLEKDEHGHRDQTRLLTERFGSAAQQLGDNAAPVRLAGAYAMAALADEWVEQRQQCIDVLCGYLRLPYTGDPGPGQPSIIVSEHTWPVGNGTGRETFTYDIRPGEREVRQSMVRVITSHLRPSAVTDWSEMTFDFTGALLEDADFSNVTFSGEMTSFDDVTFSGRATWFERATFAGERTLFAGATFPGTTTFIGATFSGTTTFIGATFSGTTTSFEGVTFSGETTPEGAFRDADFQHTAITDWGPVPPRPSPPHE